MLKNLNLGTKIGGGFSLLILIALILGGLAVISMNTVNKESTVLAEQYMPEVEIAGHLERNSLLTMFNMRGYAYTEEEGYLEKGREYLSRVYEEIEEGETLAAEADHLVKLKGSIEGVRTAVDRYRELSDQTIALNKDIADQRTILDSSAKAFMDSAYDFLQSQNDQFDWEVVNGISGQKLDQRHKKITLINDVIDIGNDIRLHVWKSQAIRDPNTLTEALPEFDVLDKKYAELLKITVLEKDRKDIRTIQSAGHDYKTAMEKMLEDWIEREHVTKERVDVANTVLKNAETLALAGQEGASHIATSASSSLSVASTTMIIGLLLAIAIGSFLAWYITRMITKPINKTVKLAAAVAQGDLSQSVHVDSNDEIGILVRTFETMMNNLRSKANAAQGIANGDLSVDIAVASDADTLGLSMVQMRENIKGLVNEVGGLADQAKQGFLNAQGDLDKFDGAWEDMISGVNEVIRTMVGHLDSVPAPVMIIDKDFTIRYMNKAGAELGGTTGEELQGTKCYNFFKTSHCGTNDCACKQAMANKKVIGEETDAHPGNLNLEIAYTGTPLMGKNGDVIGALEVVSDQTEVKTAQKRDQKIAAYQKREVEKLATSLSAMADGDLTLRYNTAKADKDTAKAEEAFSSIAVALNRTLDSLNEILGQVIQATSQVTSGSEQVSSASQSLSQGATEQASSLEEVSSTMTEIGSQTRQNADNATQANQLSESAKKAAEQGNQYMTELLTAMTDINDKSAEVQKIVKAIDEIAFQTNLLALNAAVEAARAGVHGKGFAVVAEEVRNLAQRSAKAAKETTDLIEGNVSAVTNGSRISDQTAKALQDILEGSTKVTDLVNEIEAASKEQTSAVEQINESLGQIDQVTQSNTASAEESAAAAEELSGQAITLNEMLDRFKLSDEYSHVQREMHRASRDFSHEMNNGNGHGNGKKTELKQLAGVEVSPDELISLDSDDFSNF
ncbi:HAMP domain-containing protein [bacterium]|nr:HAMP domain-containing protein [bacterium]